MAILVALGTTACGSSSTPTTPPPSGGGTSGSGSVALKTGKVAGLGTVLVDSTGRTLYVFAPDKASKVTCTGSCASVWPPLKAASGQQPTLSGAVKASLVSSDPDPSGGSVVTYHGWPLYRYAADSGPGMAQGQALNSAGGRWYVITPAGQVIKKKGGAGSHSGPGSY
jgi:predicted lipoprotein with Yx(FWY)xxD motif